VPLLMMIHHLASGIVKVENLQKNTMVDLTQK
jgi:hypothetical protein